MGISVDDRVWPMSKCAAAGVPWWGHELSVALSLNLASGMIFLRCYHELLQGDYLVKGLPAALSFKGSENPHLVFILCSWSPPFPTLADWRRPSARPLGRATGVFEKLTLSFFYQWSEKRTLRLPFWFCLLEKSPKASDMKYLASC